VNIVIAGPRSGANESAIETSRGRVLIRVLAGQHVAAGS